MTDTVRRCFELIQPATNTNKFWTVQVWGACVYVTYGRIGTKGQTQVKSFATVAGAVGYARDMVTSKKNKGYVEVISGKYPGAPLALLSPGGSPGAAARSAMPPGGVMPRGLDI